VPYFLEEISLEQCCRKRGAEHASAPPKVLICQKFGQNLSNLLGKIHENLGKIHDNPGKIGSQRCLTSKNGAPNVYRKTNKDVFGRSHQKRYSWSFWENIFVGKSRKTTFRAHLGKFRQKCFAPSKMSFLLHLCSCRAWRYLKNHIKLDKVILLFKWFNFVCQRLHRRDNTVFHVMRFNPLSIICITAKCS